MRHVSLLGVGAAVIGLSGLAYGHAHLTSPRPRVQSTDPAAPGYVATPSAAAGKTTGPCGGGANFSTAGAPTISVEQGTPFDVTFLETIEHPGHYRIALNATGNGTGAAEQILSDNIPDLTGAVPAGGRPYTQSVTIPAAVADGTYVMQLIQVMTEGGTPTYYYSCADINVGIPLPAGTPDAAPAGTPDGGDVLPDSGGGSAAADASGGGGDGSSPPGLCSYAGRSGSKPGLGIGLGLFIACGLLWRRRR